MQPLDVEAPPPRSSTSTMTIFNSYEDSYLQAARGINAHISALWSLRAAANGGGGGGAAAAAAPERIVDAATRLFEESESLARGMEIEVRSMTGADRKKCGAKAAQYRSDLLALRRAFDQARARAARELGYDGGGRALARTAISLTDSRRVLAETEDVGARVVTDLEGQRQSLLRARDNAREISYDTVEAREVLRAIARRDARHRLALYAIIAALLCAIAFVLYLKFRR
ncbi:soluble NSF attachment protein receptor [Tribonema minus]|uniref:Soluble NSF attachment protein receptor n=1 Tax=Tribonema minus TaxID=303371 RepID=A0A835ZAL4_9STRA|nr:soluble NSF attachment protein receptor [Tribonema minus]